MTIGKFDNHLLATNAGLIQQNAVMFQTIKQAEDKGVPMTGSLVLRLAMLRASHFEEATEKMLKQLEADQSKSDAINDALTAVSQYAQGFDDGTVVTRIENELKAAIAKLPPDDPNVAKLKAMIPTLHEGNDNLVTEAEMSSITQGLSQMAKEYDRDGSAAQLKINFMMQQASEVWTQASSILQVLHQTAKACIGG